MINPIYQEGEELLLNPLGSKYLVASAHTYVNSSEFVVQEDSIISVLTGGDSSVAANDIDYKSSMGLSGVTLKQGALIVAPRGESFQSMTIDSGSIMAYNSISGGVKPSGSVPLLLDTYPNASAAYSLRKLRNDYAGDAIEVRIDTATTPQPSYNIGFDSDGNLDTADLLSKAGSNDAYVAVWYDQSGNANNATQTTAAKQPKIVSSGVIELNNGKACCKFDGVNDTLIFNQQNVYSSFSVENAVLTGGFGTLGNTSNSNIIGDLNSTTARIRLNNTNYQFNVANPENSLTVLNRNINNYSLFVNNTSSSNNPISIPFDMTLNAMMNRENAFFYEGFLQESILYPTDQSSNRVAIETEINNHYTIY